MISLSNGHSFDFCVASGALGFDGRGYFFEQPWRWLGMLRPREFTIITKTLTFAPRKGNLNMLTPWRCVQPIKDGWVNAVGLTNPGIQWWIKEIYQRTVSDGYKVIVSIAPESLIETESMIEDLNNLSNIVGVELNVSCPNTNRDETLEQIIQVTDLAYRKSRHPLILKLSYDQPYLEVIKAVDGKVEAFDLINSVAWKTISKDKPSPLAPYGLVGGVSGKRIRGYSREALMACNKLGCKTPVISGGGIDSLEEVKIRERLGASAFSFGSVFIKNPWLPNQIVKQWREECSK